MAQLDQPRASPSASGEVDDEPRAGGEVLPAGQVQSAFDVVFDGVRLGVAFGHVHRPCSLRVESGWAFRAGIL